MLTRNLFCNKPEQGTTMLEVLVTIVILAFGMLGLAGLQSKIFTAEMESYQRGQAVVLLNDMVERITANRAAAANYVGTNLGNTNYPTAVTPLANCSGVAAGVARDRCEWSNALIGAAETSGGNQVGAMIGARGCITLIQAENPALGVCTPGIYLVTVAWQGLSPTSIPSATCGAGSFGTDDRLRRAISARVSVGLPSCQ